LIPKRSTVKQGCEVQPLVNDALFAVDAVSLTPGQSVSWLTPRCLIVGVVEGSLTLVADGHTLQTNAGQFSLVPACLQKVELRAAAPAKILKITPG
jgi:mannose-6-phosphate isomerase class I